MENLTISDHFISNPPLGPGPGAGTGPGAGMAQFPLPMQPQPSQPPQLPPQMFTTAAQLLDLTDKKLLVALRDGRKLIGILRSWDQFANLVLQSTVERVYASLPGAQGATDSDHGAGGATADVGPRGLYADVPRGLFMIRGENVLLLGEIDLDKDDDPPPGYARADAAVVRRMADERRAVDREREKSRLKRLARVGFEGENSGEVLL